MAEESKHENVAKATNVSPLGRVERMVSLKLTMQQLENLGEALMEVHDCGPTGSGWPSKEVEELRSIVDEELENHSS